MNFNTTGYESLELSTQLLIKEALSRDIKVDVLDERENFIRLQKGDKIEYVRQATRTSADTYIAALIMENKSVTKKVLDEHGIRTPHGKIYNDVDAALNVFENFKNKSMVVKPNSTNFGIGVSILKKDYSFKSFKETVMASFKFDSSVIVEEFIEGPEYRFLVIGERVVGILHRVPANVTGDGINTIEALVNKKNADPLRGKGYKTPLEKIRLGEVENSFLHSQGKTGGYVPQEGEAVFLRKNSNISTGGDSIDFTDEVLDDYKKIAVHSAKAAGAKICGADIIIADVNKKPDDSNHAVIELNFNPALHIHAFPYKGKNREPAKYVLDLLGF